MVFFELFSHLKSAKLNHHSVADVGVVLTLSNFQALHQAKIDELLVHQKVQSHKVCTGLFQSGGVVLQCFFRRSHPGVETTRGMSYDFVKRSVELSSHIAMGLGPFHFGRAEGKFFQEAAAGSFVVSPFNVSKAHGLTSVFCTYPVGIGQIHANGCGRRSIA
ncbi:MAG: Uncharacterised protein [Flavobacteriia bacterium]|nr:MAG: Uncharacterised protein [Flavobacteriia bacterium]